MTDRNDDLLDGTHDPAFRSWVESANDPGTDFPPQNLPFGRFRVEGDPGWRIGVAIGDKVLDLRAAGLVDHADMQRLMALSVPARRNLRHSLSNGLRSGSVQQADWRHALHPADAVVLGTPCPIGNYTDFYVGIHHATAVGRLFRPDNPLLPNYHWIPIGYHGRASTVFASGHAFRRPMGQLRPGDGAPHLAPTQRLDYEVELGVFVGQPNVAGEQVAMASAEDHVFGLALFNDWSARDVQAWEYQPLGPFLSKNFASTVSPWMVTLEALAPFRRPHARAADQPEPLPYLDSPANRGRGAFDVELEVWLATAAMRAAGQPAVRLARSNFADAAFWSVAQLVAHHTVNGCLIQSGDLFGTGTLSGPLPEQAGSLLELTRGGRTAIALPHGETRTFIEDGDRVELRGYCERPGLRRIGFGSCAATVLPPPAHAA